MIVKRFYDEKLAQASYLVGCAATGEALVVDPSRDAEQFVAAAEEEGLRITHITETHIHADFLSGARELTERTGARLLLSDEGPAEWKYQFAGAYDAVLLRDGDHFMVGNVRIDVLHTPGHTPEHLCFVVTDTAAANRPMGVFTGDFIFVGDVGRPDLLERAVGYEGTMEAGARTLFRSLRRFRAALPEWVQLWPGHGSGSACGKSLGAVPQTTLGYEARFGWALALEDEEEFVRAVLAGQPEPPVYFARMKRMNREGPPVLDGLPSPALVAPERLDALQRDGALVVDTRPAEQYAAGHLAGTLNIPLGRSFTTWAGSVLPYHRDIVLLLAEAGDQEAAALARDLAMIGIDRVAGYADAEAAVQHAERSGGSGTVAQVTPEDLQRVRESGDVEVIDVRNGAEWEAGHLPGSHNVPLGRLVEQLERIPRDRPLVVHCQAGGRASVAISALRSRGYSDVSHLQGDFAAWTARGLPVDRGRAVAAGV